MTNMEQTVEAFRERPWAFEPETNRDARLFILSYLLKFGNTPAKDGTLVRAARPGDQCMYLEPESGNKCFVGVFLTPGTEAQSHQGNVYGIVTTEHPVIHAAGWVWASRLQILHDSSHGTAEEIAEHLREGLNHRLQHETES